MKKQSNILYSLGALRVIASFFVVISHFNHMLTETYAQSPYGEWVNFGGLGVDYFFLLSGFLMYQIHRKEWGMPKHTLHFISKRVTRIFPMYWIALILMMIFIQFTSEPRLPVGLDWFYEFALIQPDNPRILDVSWTLNIEMMFYFIFCFTLLPVWGSRIFMFGWFLLTIFGVAGHYSLLFITGCFLSFVFSILRNIQFSRVFIMLTATIGCVTVLGMEYYSDTNNDVSEIFDKAVISFGFFLLLGSLLLWEVQKGASIMSSKIVCTFANSAYCIYLFHIMIGWTLFKIAQVTGVDEMINKSVLLTGMIIITVLSGVVIQKTIEAPINKRLRKVTERFKSN